MKLGRAPLALTLLLGSGCALSLDEEHLEDLNPPFGDVRELCVQAPPTGVSQATAFSLALPTANAFFFGDTTVAEGSSFAFLPNTEALVTDPENPCSLDYVTTGLAPQKFWIGRVDVHPGLGSADGKRFVFGYHTDNASAPGLHLVEAVVQ